MNPRTLLLVVALSLGITSNGVFAPQSTLAAELDDQFCYFPLIFSGPVEHSLYLPIIATGQFSEISNSGFEAGYSGWSFTQGDIINNDSDYVHSGLKSARLGNGISVATERAINQPVSVPQDRYILSYWQYVLSNEACNPPFRYDYVSIYIDNHELFYYDICNQLPQQAWYEMTADLYDYRGMYIDLRISFTSDGSVASDLYVDDFSFINP